MQRIVLASGTRGKLKEFQQLLSGCGFDVSPQSEFDVPEADETGLSFIENAILKARNAAHYTSLPAIADDSGLEVDALNGEPGIYSARYAGADATDADNNQKLLTALEDTPDTARTARFHCVLAFVRHEKDPVPIICHGSWEGRILRSPQGDNGFGYDPLFYVPEKKSSSAQLPPELKNRISHRGQAMAKLLALFAKT